MSGHQEFLALLLRAFPNQVYLVNRYSDTGLGFTDDVLRLFIPDLHWMSMESQTAYPGYYFNKTTINGRLVFAVCLDVASTYQATGNALEVFQLGDRFDLWREATLKPRAPRTLYNRIRNDEKVGPLADALDALGTAYARGNHDHWLKLIDKELPIAQRSDKERPSADGKIVALHGHVFDQIEYLLPDNLKAEAVRRYPGAEMHTRNVGYYSAQRLATIRETQRRRRQDPTYPFLPNVTPQGALPLTDPGDLQALEQVGTWHLDVRQFFHGDDDESDFESKIHFLRFAGKIYNTEKRRKVPRRVYVIGHTHNARLFVDTHPKDGGPLVLMDCGGWIEYCTTKMAPDAQAVAAPSGQIGVQHGNDLRIYQLGGPPT